MRKLCNLLGISRSGFYAWRSRVASAREKHDEVLKQAILEMHRGFRRAYGARRVHQMLRQKGLICSVRRASRLMKEAGISASTKGLYVWNPGGTGWLYHAVVVDLFSRRVVGWPFSRKRNSELTKSALRMALLRENPLPGCLFHSDQGIEYAAHDYRDILSTAEMRRSMSRKGNPLDNAMVESFFHTLKAGLVHQQHFESDIEAVARIVEYIEFYNRDRLHSGVGYQSPHEHMLACA